MTTKNPPTPQTIPLLVVIFLISIPAQAQYGGGSGTAEDPYLITTAADLIALGESPGDYGKHFVLVADINLDPNLPVGKVFTRAIIAPDVDSESDFQGSIFTGDFDGNRHAIKRLTIKSDTSFLGLFGKIGPAGKVHDVCLDDIHVSSSAYCVSGLAGYNCGSITDCRISGTVSGGADEWCSHLALLAGRNRGNIINCQTDGHVSSESTERGFRLGLLVGYNSGAISHCDANGTVTAGALFSDIGGLAGENADSMEDCHSSCSIAVGSIYGGTGRYGGLAGSNSGTISRCYATGDVSFGKYAGNAGGLVGYNSGRITGCYALGDVSGPYSNWRLGGVVGNNTGQISHCYARGDVTGDGNIGGLVGENRGDISQTYATGRADGSSHYVPGGGLVGDSDPDDVSGSYWDIETSGRVKSEGGKGLSTARMQDPSTFLDAGWDLVGERANGTGDVWQVPEDGGYPTLTFFTDEYRRPELAGSGTADDAYQVATAEDLGTILHNDYKTSYRLVADVNLAGITWTTAVIPSFDGTFDGNGFIISNLMVHGGDYLGLFGALGKHAVVENLGIKDANIVGGNSASRLGMLAARNLGRIADCLVTGSVSGGQYEERLGGIVGYNLGTIINCDPIEYDGPYSVIITDPEATRQFLRFEGIKFDEVWIPEEADLEGLGSILETSLDPERHGYIVENLARYDREYSGFVLDGSRYVICQMILGSGLQGSAYVAKFERGSEFTIIFDGGCGIVRVIFDLNNKTVVSISCNGMA